MMRRFRHVLRLFSARHSMWRSLLQALLVVSLLAISFMYLHEKNEKEALIDWALGTGSVDELVQPDNDTIILLNGLQNGVSSLKEKIPFVVIVVTSLPGSVYRRNIIRNTWAKKAYENYGASVVFFLGRPHSTDNNIIHIMENLAREGKEHQDLIIDNFQESYYALAIKTLRVFKYFKFHHPKSKFLVKTDDDVFVNVRNLVHFCYTRNHEFEVKHQEDQDNSNPSSSLFPFHFVAGVIHSNRAPHTWNSFSKWYAPQSVWSAVYNKVVQMKNLGKVGTFGGESHSVVSDGSGSSVMQLLDTDISANNYPPYAEGNFYILSDDAVVDILDASKNVPLYHLEDVYVTGVLATWILGIEKENMQFISSASNSFPTFSYRWYTKFTSSAEELIAFHCDNNVELITTIYNESEKS